MEEVMYGQGMNMADVLVRPEPSVQTFGTQSSTYSPAPKNTNDSAAVLNDIDLAKDGAQGKAQIVYLHGVRFYLLTVALCLALFLSTLEITIVSTALVSISDELHGFHKDSWVITSYLVTYTGFLIILARLSDIFGRKPLIMFTVVIFIAFSAGCGAAQTLNQLIVMRAFQGIGGGGIYTLVFVMSAELVPVTQYAKITSLMSVTFAISSLLGPILGGLICDHSTWRWVFYLNLPAGALSLILILLSMPRGFPFMGSTQHTRSKLTTASLRRVDYTGTALLLAASILLVTALQEGGTEYSWRSACVLVLLFISFIAWAAFFIRERHQSKKKDRSQHVSVLPWHLITNRFWASMMLHAFFTGLAYLTMVIALPQKFQVVNGDSGFKAGYRLLALMMSFSLGAILSSVLTEKRRIPPFCTFIIAGCLQTLGLGLMISLSTTQQSFPPAQYGYEIMMGFGFGLSISTLIMSIPLVALADDHAVSMGAVAQARTLGGTLGISICTNLLDKHIKDALKKVLSPQQISDLLGSARWIAGFPEDVRPVVKRIYAEGYRDQAIALTAFAGVGLLVVGMMWERPLRRMSKKFSAVRGYGEVEFVLSITKIIAVIGFIILGIIIDCGGVPTDTRGYMGAHYWHDPGSFRNGFRGFYTVFVTAAFAFAGTELIGLAAAEAANPRESLPTATRQVFWRITVFYFLSLFIVGLIVPSDSPDLLGASGANTKASPFVLAIKAAGIKGPPSVLNAVITISILSVANSCTFASTLTMQALAINKLGPRFLAYPIGVEAFFQTYLALSIVIALYVCYKTYDRFYLRSSGPMYISAHQMELFTGLRSLDHDEQIKPDKSVRDPPMRGTGVLVG
ncbi:MAG: hypothetical protein Q9210_002627 [Variospora velana]